MKDSLQIKLYGILPESRTNGPGKRIVIWFQGCTLNCPGCFNPESHTKKAKLVKTLQEVDTHIIEQSNIEGVTISGGEPFQQQYRLYRLLQLIKAKSQLSVILFSGYEIEEIEKFKYGKKILHLTDILIAGRYKQQMHTGRGLCGSSNKTLHLFSNRYKVDDIINTPEAEITISTSGKIFLSGIDPLMLGE